MNLMKWLLASLGAFVTFFILDMITHTYLLMDAYTATESVWRPISESKPLYWMVTVGQAIFALAFAFLYTRGYESDKGGLGQGIRFGIYTGIFLAASSNFAWYVVLPIPFELNLAWLASAFVNCLVAGTVVGLIYRN